MNSHMMESKKHQTAWHFSCYLRIQIKHYIAMNRQNTFVWEYHSSSSIKLQFYKSYLFKYRKFPTQRVFACASNWTVRWCCNVDFKTTCYWQGWQSIPFACLVLYDHITINHIDTQYWSTSLVCFENFIES